MPACYEKDMLTCSEAARTLGVCEHVVWRLAAVQRIRAVERVGRPIRFDRLSVEQLAASQAAAPEKAPKGRRTRPAAAAGK
jgi:excisionase family DNA binding protein